jgi:Flp pilus assembly protein TadD
MKRYVDAISDCNEAMRIDPNNAIAYNNRGYAYIYTNQYATGIADCTEAIRLNPNYPAAYSNRAYAYQQIGETEKARADRAMTEKLLGRARQQSDRPTRR